MQKSPDAFRTISEVADWLGVPTHVLRFWESRFAQVKPVKRAGGRRYYRPADMLLIGGIKRLLHDDGMTIRGVQKLLREEGIRHVQSYSRPLEDEVLVPLAVGDHLARGRPADGASDRAPHRTSDADESAEISRWDRDLAGEDEAPDGAGDAGSGGEAAPGFGSIRQRDPELPFLRPRTGAVPGPVAEASGPAEAGGLQRSDAAPEAAPAERPKLRIPPTPEVPDSDPEDESEAHVRPPGQVAALYRADRAALAQRRGVVEAVAALRALRVLRAG